jgi:hypothetical protein
VPTLLLATTPSPVPEPIDPARVTPGVLGFLAILFLAVSVFLLWRSMNKQIKRIQFEGSVPVDPEPADATVAADASAGDASPDASAPDAPVSGTDTSPEPTDR